MAALYVIGNGFDLWHKLPTSYAGFYDFAKEVLDEIENYYSFGINQVKPWCDFENALGYFSWEKFYHAHNNIDVSAEDFRPSFVYGLEDDLREQADQYVEAVRDCLREWMAGIDILIANKRMVFPGDARFITFNYTSTLQSIYDISNANVLHIHGRAEAFEELIFGHGETREEEPDFYENGEGNRTIFSDAEGFSLYPFYALQKPVEKILDRHKEFFSTLSGVTDIIVIGHSLNKIDLPYFRRIHEQARGANWTLCLHTPDEKAHRMQALIECGVSLKHINFFSYTDLEIKHHHEPTPSL